MMAKSSEVSEIADALNFPKKGQIIDGVEVKDSKCKLTEGTIFGYEIHLPSSVKVRQVPKLLKEFHLTHTVPTPMPRIVKYHDYQTKSKNGSLIVVGALHIVPTARANPGLTLEEDFVADYSKMELADPTTFFRKFSYSGFNGPQFRAKLFSLVSYMGENYGYCDEDNIYHRRASLIMPKIKITKAVKGAKMMYHTHPKKDEPSLSSADDYLLYFDLSHKPRHIRHFFTVMADRMDYFHITPVKNSRKKFLEIDEDKFLKEVDNHMNELEKVWNVKIPKETSDKADDLHYCEGITKDLVKWMNKKYASYFKVKYKCHYRVRKNPPEPESEDIHLSDEFLIKALEDIKSGEYTWPQFNSKKMPHEKYAYWHQLYYVLHDRDITMNIGKGWHPGDQRRFEHYLKTNIPESGTTYFDALNVLNFAYDVAKSDSKIRDSGEIVSRMADITTYLDIPDNIAEDLKLVETVLHTEDIYGESAKTLSGDYYPILVLAHFSIQCIEIMKQVTGGYKEKTLAQLEVNTKLKPNARDVLKPFFIEKNYRDGVRINPPIHIKTISLYVDLPSKAFDIPELYKEALGEFSVANYIPTKPFETKRGKINLRVETSFGMVTVTIERNTGTTLLFPTDKENYMESAMEAINKVGMALYRYGAPGIKSEDFEVKVESPAMNPSPQIIALSGPSGSGKSTTLRTLIKSLPNSKTVATITTRPPRKSDKPGEKTFVKDSEFKQMLGNGELVAAKLQRNGHYYGRKRSDFAGADYIILDVSLSGLNDIRKVFPNTFSVYLEPSESADFIEKRLLRRGDISPQEARGRAKLIPSHIESSKKMNFDLRVKTVQGKFDYAAKEVYDAIPKMNPPSDVFYSHDEAEKAAQRLANETGKIHYIIRSVWFLEGGDTDIDYEIQDEPLEDKGPYPSDFPEQVAIVYPENADKRAEKNPSDDVTSIWGKLAGPPTNPFNIRKEAEDFVKADPWLGECWSVCVDAVYEFARFLKWKHGKNLPKSVEKWKVVWGVYLGKRVIDDDDDDDPFHVYIKHTDGRIIDLTADQFGTEIKTPYFPNKKERGLYKGMNNKAEGTVIGDLYNGRPIENPKILTPADLRKRPKTLFVFGDNDKGTGKGGQAENRDEPNAVGFRTKHKPTTSKDAYYSDDNYTDNIRKMQEDLDNIKRLSVNYDSVYFMPGIGEGRALLKEKAPKTYGWMKDNLPKMNPPWKTENHKNAYLMLEEPWSNIEVPIDERLAPLVQHLWSKGVPTSYSDQGIGQPTKTGYLVIRWPYDYALPIVKKLEKQGKLHIDQGGIRPWKGRDRVFEENTIMIRWGTDPHGRQFTKIDGETALKAIYKGFGLTYPTSREAALKQVREIKKNPPITPCPTPLKSVMLNRIDVGVPQSEDKVTGEYIALNFHPEAISLMHKAAGVKMAKRNEATSGDEGANEEYPGGYHNDFITINIKNWGPVDVDWKLARLVEALNNKHGIETMGSDQGSFDVGTRIEGEVFQHPILYGFITCDKDSMANLIGLFEDIPGFEVGPDEYFPNYGGPHPRSNPAREIPEYGLHVSHKDNKESILKQGLKGKRIFLFYPDADWKIWVQSGNIDGVWGIGGRDENPDLEDVPVENLVLFKVRFDKAKFRPAPYEWEGKLHDEFMVEGEIPPENIKVVEFEKNPSKISLSRLADSVHKDNFVAKGKQGAVFSIPGTKLLFKVNRDSNKQFYAKLMKHLKSGGPIEYPTKDSILYKVDYKIPFEVGQPRYWVGDDSLDTVMNSIDGDVVGSFIPQAEFEKYKQYSQAEAGKTNLYPKKQIIKYYSYIKTLASIPQKNVNALVKQIEHLLSKGIPVDVNSGNLIYNSKTQRLHLFDWFWDSLGAGKTLRSGPPFVQLVEYGGIAEWGRSMEEYFTEFKTKFPNEFKLVIESNEKHKEDMITWLSKVSKAFKVVGLQRGKRNIELSRMGKPREGEDYETFFKRIVNDGGDIEWAEGLLKHDAARFDYELANPNWRHGTQAEDDPFEEYFTNPRIEDAEIDGYNG